ncbi:LPP20 family lipoprotein [Dasania sp. GY-MA-18]|uniref:LPP20 family lipoprotein n=1 Tax=Dasania phycosphaerae TaxID=2950436 RepID=A0A9J6RGR5_9GAMM|nr:MULTISPECIES: LPP20 family lipoprotein [Dasania]MCR8921418.1 LPP20 family lipoprotein [Dasania sp. GY-MA-18]MCZ0863846.1 LPP20 family lipoprotein [Dasania phycosphaerae]MCZ0867574.1 LPP20 family lipoprotein [Dasania phycosphaerae]
MAALTGCKTVSSQVQHHTGDEQAQREAELHAQADDAFAELEGKAKKRPLTPPQTSPALQKPSASDPMVKTHQRQPDWVMTPPSNPEYVFGVGSAGINSTSATASQIADEQAKVNLAAKLRVSVSAVNNAQERLQQGVVSQSFNSEVRNTVAPTSYSGLSIIERYIDKANATVYALAALHKASALSNLQQQIAQLDQQLLAASQASAQGSTLNRLRKALPSLKLLAQREQLNQQALDISNGQQSFALSPELIEFQNIIYALLDTLQFRIVQNGDAILRDSLIKTLTDQGMRVSQQGAADIVLSYKVNWRHIHRDSQHYQLANATVSLQDEQGKTLSTFIEKAKGISSDAGLAKDKALEKLAQQLSQSLGANLVKAID